MIVVDASVVVAWALQASAHDDLNRLLAASEGLAAPHLVDAEVAHALCRFNLRGDLSSDLAVAAIEDFQALPLKRFPHGWLLERAFALRHNATIYDALYIALAEALPAKLVTTDRALALIPEVRTSIEVIG